MRAVLSRTAAIFASAMLCTAAQAAPQKIVVNQSAPSLSAAAVYLARDTGLFAKEGLDVDFVATGSGLKSIVPLINGDSQFCACIFSHPIDAMKVNAGDVKVIATLITGYNHKIVLGKEQAQKAGVTPDSPLEARVKALKAQKIGITEPNASTDQVVRLLMKDAGLDASKDSTLIALGAQNLPPAIQNHQIDAFVMTPPVPERAIAAGDAIPIVDLGKDKIPLLRDSLYMAIAVDPNFLAKNRDLAVKFVRAIAKAQVLLAEHPDQARKILKEKQFASMDQPTFDASFDGNIAFYAHKPEVSLAGVQTALDLAKRFSREPITLKADALIDNSIAADAEK